MNVGEELRRKFDLRPCSVVLDRVDLSVTIQTEAKIQRKRKRTEDAEWNPPAAKSSGEKQLSWPPGGLQETFLKFLSTFSKN